jgi:hypothetical protein
MRSLFRNSRSTSTGAWGRGVGLGEGRLQDLLQGRPGHRLDQEVVGTGSHALDHQVPVAAPGKDHHRHVRALELDLAGQVKGVRVELIDVEEDQLRVEARQERQGLGGGPRLEDGVAGLLHHPNHSRAALWPAVDDEDRAGRHRAGGARSGRAGVKQGLDEGDTGPDTGIRQNP